MTGTVWDKYHDKIPNLVIDCSLTIDINGLYFRADAQSKMISLKEKAVKDLTQYNAEIKDLERLIAHECNLKEFMTTKCNERSVGDQCENPIHSAHITAARNGQYVLLLFKAGMSENSTQGQPSNCV